MRKWFKTQERTVIIGVENSESEDDESDQDINNFAAFVSESDDLDYEVDVLKESKESYTKNKIEEYDSTDDKSEDELKPEYKEICDTLIRVTKENATLIREKASLRTLIKELEAEVTKEKNNSLLLKSELNERLRQVRMLNSGTKELDKILIVGRTKKTCSVGKNICKYDSGLGYQGSTLQDKTTFVSGGNL